MHPGAAPHSPHFTFIVSQDPDVKSSPNLLDPRRSSDVQYFRRRLQLKRIMLLRFQDQEARERYGRQLHARLTPHRSYTQGVQCFRHDAVLCSYYGMHVVGRELFITPGAAPGEDDTSVAETPSREKSTDDIAGPETAKGRNPIKPHPDVATRTSSPARSRLEISPPFTIFVHLTSTHVNVGGREKKPGGSGGCVRTCKVKAGLSIPVREGKKIVFTWKTSELILERYHRYSDRLPTASVPATSAIRTMLKLLISNYLTGAVAESNPKPEVHPHFIKFVNQYLQEGFTNCTANRIIQSHVGQKFVEGELLVTGVHLLTSNSFRWSTHITKYGLPTCSHVTTLPAILQAVGIGRDDSLLVPRSAARRCAHSDRPAGRPPYKVGTSRWTVSMSGCCGIAARGGALEMSVAQPGLRRHKLHSLHTLSAKGREPSKLHNCRLVGSVVAYVISLARSRWFPATRVTLRDARILKADEDEAKRVWSTVRMGGGNGISPRKPANQRHRPARSPHARIQRRPRRESNQVLTGGRLVVQPLTTAAPQAVDRITQTTSCGGSFGFFNMGVVVLRLDARGSGNGPWHLIGYCMLHKVFREHMRDRRCHRCDSNSGLNQRLLGTFPNLIPTKPVNYPTSCTFAAVACLTKRKLTNGVAYKWSGFHMWSRTQEQYTWPGQVALFTRLDCSPPNKGEPGFDSQRGSPRIFSHMGIVPDDATGPWVSSRISSALAFQRCSILTPRHPHRLSRPRSGRAVTQREDSVKGWKLRKGEEASWRRGQATAGTPERLDGGGGSSSSFSRKSRRPAGWSYTSWAASGDRINQRRDSRAVAPRRNSDPTPRQSPQLKFRKFVLRGDGKPEETGCNGATSPVSRQKLVGRSQSAGVSLQESVGKSQSARVSRQESVGKSQSARKHHVITSLPPVNTLHTMFTVDEGTRMMKHYDNDHMQFIQGNIMKEHIKTYKGSSTGSQQVMSLIPPATSMSTVSADDCDEASTNLKRLSALNTDDDHVTPTKKSKLDIEDETRGEDDHENSIDDNDCGDSVDEVSDDDSLDVPTHFTKEFPSLRDEKKKRNSTTGNCEGKGAESLTPAGVRNCAPRSLSESSFSRSRLKLQRTETRTADRDDSTTLIKCAIATKREAFKLACSVRVVLPACMYGLSAATLPFYWWQVAGEVQCSVGVRLLGSHLGEAASIPGGVAPGVLHVGIPLDDGFSLGSHVSLALAFRSCPYTYLTSPSSLALQTSMLRAAKSLYLLTQLCIYRSVISLAGCCSNIRVFARVARGGWDRQLPGNHAAFFPDERNHERWLPTRSPTAPFKHTTRHIRKRMLAYIAHSPYLYRPHPGRRHLASITLAEQVWLAIAGSILARTFQHLELADANSGEGHLKNSGRAKDEDRRRRMREKHARWLVRPPGGVTKWNWRNHLTECTHAGCAPPPPPTRPDGVGWTQTIPSTAQVLLGPGAVHTILVLCGRFDGQLRSGQFPRGLEYSRGCAGMSRRRRAVSRGTITKVRRKAC
ncbi:hypothetical protein PR048_029035 [Dryococelus australis]|uniref:Uncharacterized protein n=1 Tax=Dryococelus australis TaxID=614101 RepID=A0ABQ9GC84_9NEOP|nr:hypothetical protein PR048_029035 [Dryococelus australis]